MLLRIHAADKLDDDLWLVYFWVDEEPRFPIMRLVPVGYPKQCLGGAWCEDFGCTPGDNVFTRAEPELIVEEGTEVPDDFDIRELWGNRDEEDVFEGLE